VRAGVTPAAFIIARVAAHYGTTVDDMLMKGRLQPRATRRQVAMYLARELTDYSLLKIGRAFERDHTTIAHGIEATKERMLESPDFRNRVALLGALIGKDLREARHVRDCFLESLLSPQKSESEFQSATCNADEASAKEMGAPA
jgi:hypothetical protein